MDMARKNALKSPQRRPSTPLRRKAGQARSLATFKRKIAQADRAYAQGVSRLMTPVQRRLLQTLRGRDRLDFAKQNRIDVRSLQRLKHTRVQAVQRALMALYPACMPDPRKAR